MSLSTVLMILISTNKDTKVFGNFAGVKISFHTLGCKVNFAETSALARSMVAATGPDEVPQETHVVNTCTVTAAADKKCRNLIARLHRSHPEARIIVTGCWARRDPEAVSALPGVSELLLRDFSCFSPAWSEGERTRSFLKVQDGCDYCCSYCAIHSARGPSRNAPISDLVSQAHIIASQGIKEIVLTGVNTGDFGRSTGERFIDLLRALDSVPDIARYRISSIEPNLLTDSVIDFCASSDKFQPHFHIPLQSGSDHILGLMRRRYTSSAFAERLARVREKMPDAFFGVDVIVGFPGESEGCFAQTVSLIAQTRPSQLHVFPYSVRPGTPAAEFPDRVSPPVAAARAKRLAALSDELHSAFCSRFSGRVLPVLWEGSCRGGMMSGFTGNYIRVFAPYDSALIGTVSEAQV